MKELGNSLLQLVAMIMVMITLAISTAALSQWANSEANTNINGSDVQRNETTVPHLSASVVR
jgi:chitodextrinase